MTAIAGVWRWDGAPTADDCSRMLASQAMYGPDARASRNLAQISIGRNLFRTLPEDRFDRQPLVGGGGRFALVADVRLGNRDELAAALDLTGERLDLAADADLLLAALIRWGDAAVARLVGAYAFAFWDADHHRLVLARDPLGHRPLVFHRADRLFAFASMPKGLHALADVPYEADEERLIEELALLPDVGSRTHFKGVERVMPGHICTVTPTTISTSRFWNPAPALLKLKRPEDYQEALREVFDTAVRATLRGAGDIGSDLSGGLDSSSVTATAARLLAGTDRRVIAFTGAPRAGYALSSGQHTFADESAHAAATAALYDNIQHVIVPTPPGSVLAPLNRLMLLTDRPPGALPNQRWTIAIFDEAKARGMKVMLSGAMGNMTISYNGINFLNQLFASGRWWRLAREAAALKRTGRRSWLSMAAQVIGPLTPAPVWRRLTRDRFMTAQGLAGYTALRPEIANGLELAAKARDRALDPSYRPRGDDVRLWVALRGDAGAIGKGVLAGWGIDRRDPTADRRLFEFCLSVPMEQYLRDGQTAALLRGAFADRLPPMVLNELRAGQQAADWHEGVEAGLDDLKEELAREAASGPVSRIVDVERLRAALDNFPTGGWLRPEVKATYQFALLRGVSAGYFLRRVAGGND